MNLINRLRQFSRDMSFWTTEFWYPTHWICQYCKVSLNRNELWHNASFSKNKKWKGYLCNRCKKLFMKTSNQCNEFKKKGVFWAEEE